MHSLLRAQVPSLVGELRSHKPCSVAKKKKIINYSRITQDRGQMPIIYEKTTQPFSLTSLSPRLNLKSITHLDILQAEKEFQHK